MAHPAKQKGGAKKMQSAGGLGKIPKNPRPQPTPSK